MPNEYKNPTDFLRFMEEEENEAIIKLKLSVHLFNFFLIIFAQINEGKHLNFNTVGSHPLWFTLITFCVEDSQET